MGRAVGAAGTDIGKLTCVPQEREDNEWAWIRAALSAIARPPHAGNWNEVDTGGNTMQLNEVHWNDLIECICAVTGKLADDDKANCLLNEARQDTPVIRELLINLAVRDVSASTPENTNLFEMAYRDLRLLLALREYEWRSQFWEEDDSCSGYTDYDPDSPQDESGHGEDTEDMLEAADLPATLGELDVGLCRSCLLRPIPDYIGCCPWCNAIDPYRSVADVARKLLAKGKRTEAIEIVRDVTGADQRKAEEYCDELKVD